MSTRQRRSVSAARLGCLLRRRNAAAVLCASWVTPQSLSVCHSSERLRRAHPVSCPAAVLRHPASRAAHPLGGRLEGALGGDERGGGERGSADSGGDEGCSSERAPAAPAAQEGRRRRVAPRFRRRHYRCRRRYRHRHCCHGYRHLRCRRHLKRRYRRRTARSLWPFVGGVYAECMPSPPCGMPLPVPRVVSK